ncbi:ABC transporter ATP-binding protein [Halocatena halophila]|uniref:ABC transporter ATP-binding protein n=1 Tax=Halocatena halophila TaxID=2814576 RepID=UPI002ED644A9
MTTTQPHRLQTHEPILELNDVSVTFSMDRGDSRVVDEVTLDIERNEVLGIVGESGSGKSMLASALLDAVVDPGTVSGEITFHPQDEPSVSVLELSKADRQRFRWEQIAMVFQGAMSSFNPVRTIRTHFVETLSAHDDDIETGMKRAAGILEDLYLDPDRVLDSYPHELSGGMKQRALIALSLVLEPEVLVMDEPTAALDLLMQRSIIGLLEEIKTQYDLTIVFITHDLPLVADIADRVAVLYAFEIAELGPTEEILSEPAHPYTRLLLKSTPNLQAPIESMQPVEGAAPDPVNVPEGCSFHPRCPLADETCQANDPDAATVSDRHTADCHHYEAAPGAIPLEPPEMDEIERTPRHHGSAGEPLLSLDGLEVHFETEQKGLGLFGEPETVSAVDGVSLDIYENDVVVLVGESGCGKTTLGKAAIGLQEPTGGTVRYRGQDIYGDDSDVDATDRFSADEIRRALQIVHQDPGSSLNPHHRIRSILEAPLKQWYDDLDGNDRQSRILGLLEHVGMTPADDYIDRYPHQLSGGEQQRVALIRAMLLNPELILADEPISALDVSLRVEMMDLLIQLQETFNTSYLFVSHDLSNARYIAEKTGGRIGVVYLGELVEIGPPEQIIHDPQHPYTRALRWATPQLTYRDDRAQTPPIRTIDIPDPTDPPSGCRYHTRCPEARKVCAQSAPATKSGSDAEGHEVACYRVQDDHDYWEDAPIDDADLD